MKQPFGEAAGGLTPDHIEALNAVDLRVYTGIHGIETEIPKYGPLVVGVTDLEYAGMRRVVAGLEPERGDVLALEAIAHTSNAAEERALEKLDYVLVNSPYLNADERNFGRALKDARDFRVIPPFEYATLLAHQKGIDVMYADMSLDEVRRYVTKFPDFNLIQLAESSQRNQAITCGLGEIATTMVPSNEKPVLAYGVGRVHGSSLRQIFSENGITATFRKFGPNRSLEAYAYSWRDVASFVTRGAIRPSSDVFTDEWITNAEAVQRQRKQGR